jgi:hypothetical protein
MTFNESNVEEAALTWFGDLGYAIAHRLNSGLEPPVASASFVPDRTLEVET